MHSYRRVLCRTFGVSPPPLDVTRCCGLMALNKRASFVLLGAPRILNMCVFGHKHTLYTATTSSQRCMDWSDKCVDGGGRAFDTLREYLFVCTFIIWSIHSERVHWLRRESWWIQMLTNYQNRVESELNRILSNIRFEELIKFDSHFSD